MQLMLLSGASMVTLSGLIVGERSAKSQNNSDI
jgi:hypothetical protein